MTAPARRRADEAAFLARYAVAPAPLPTGRAHRRRRPLHHPRRRACLLLSVRRAHHPNAPSWALPAASSDLGPGNFGEGEDLEDAARRELAEETGFELFPDHLGAAADLRRPVA